MFCTVTSMSPVHQKKDPDSVVLFKSLLNQLKGNGRDLYSLSKSNEKTWKLWFWAIQIKFDMEKVNNVKNEQAQLENVHWVYLFSGFINLQRQNWDDRNK